MTTKNIQDVVAEKVEEYRELMKVHQSNMQVVEVLDKPQVEIRIPFLEDWLTTTLTQLVKEVEERERDRIKIEFEKRAHLTENPIETSEGIIDGSFYNIYKGHFEEALTPRQTN